MKRLPEIVACVAVLSSGLACRDEAAVAELQAMQAQAAAEQRNKEVMLTFFEAWGKGDFETLTELTTADYAFCYPSNTANPLSREELEATYRRIREGFPDVTWSIEELHTGGDTVVLRFVQTGTHEGVFQGIPATGKRIETSGIAVSRVVNGQIIEQREEYDMLGVVTQLGMTVTPQED